MNKFEYEYNGKLYKVINPGRIVRIDEIFYQNQLEDVNNDYSVKFTMRKPIFHKYGLTCQQYYNLVVYGELEHNELCECKTCGKNYKKFNGLAYGYSRFCSGKCASLQKGYDKSDYLKSLYKLGKNPIYTKESRCNSDFNRLMKSKYHKPDDIYTLYIAIPTFCKNSIKIGVSSCDYRRSTAYDRNDYSNMVPIIRCELKIAAEMEKLIKLKFINMSLENYTEVFSIDILDDIISYINELLVSYKMDSISSTTIEKVKSLVE